jgi:hypothetical protein
MQRNELIELPRLPELSSIQATHLHGSASIPLMHGDIPRHDASWSIAALPALSLTIRPPHDTQAHFSTP